MKQVPLHETSRRSREAITCLHRLCMGAGKGVPSRRFLRHFGGGVCMCGDDGSCPIHLWGVGCGVWDVGFDDKGLVYLRSILLSGPQRVWCI